MISIDFIVELPESHGYGCHHVRRRQSNQVRAFHTDAYHHQCGRHSPSIP
jgi:hypothetical protein